MRFWRMALRNLSRRPIRSTLSILGVAISVMLILSVGVSSVRYASLVRESRLLYGDRLIVVSKSAYFAEAVPIGSSLSNTSIDVVNGLMGVAHAAPILTIVNLQGLLPTNITFAVPPNEWQNVFQNLQVQSGGRLPLQNGEVAVGSVVSSGNNLQVGSKLNVGSAALTVSGVLYSSPSPVVDHAVFMTLLEGQKLFGYLGLISMIAVTPIPGTNETALQAEITQALSGVSVLTEQQRGEDAEPLLQQFEAWSSGVEVVAFILSMLFIATLSLINVFERRRELATAYAVGATRRTLLRISVLENAFVGVIGGSLGVLLGLLASVYINLAVSTMPPSLIIANLQNILPPFIALEVLLLTVFVSALTGGLVFLAAMKRDVAAILRYEA